MSEKTNNSFDLQKSVRSGLRLTLIFIAVTLVVCVSSSFLLIATGEPEKYYQALSFAVPVLSSFLTARLFINRTSLSLLDVLFYSLFVIVIVLFLSLLLDDTSFTLFGILMKLLLIVISGFAGVLVSGNGKKRKKIKKRR